MMIKAALLQKLFDAAFMKRWNDKARPVDLTELDKQAHKMVLAYILGKFEESSAGFDWIKIIEGGLFEFLQRIVVTDLKPPIFYKIKQDTEKYRRLNDWVYEQLTPYITPLGPDFCQRFRDHFLQPVEDINRQILNAAHFYATKWEFDIIQQANPNTYDIEDIRRDIQSQQEKYRTLHGMILLAQEAALGSQAKPMTRFINLCGELRFQIRWSNLHRIPQNSVMGHMLFVAMTAYLFSLTIHACRQRRINNYFTGLFHDLPEVLTRDIVSPVKRNVGGLEDLIKDYEIELMEKEVYSLIPAAWHEEIRMFTEQEFANRVVVNGKVLHPDCETINRDYNQDVFSPRDGDLIKAADMLAAFIEAHVAIRNGSASPDLYMAQKNIKYKYQSEIKSIGGIDFGQIYYDFD